MHVTIFVFSKSAIENLKQPLLVSFLYWFIESFFPQTAKFFIDKIKGSTLDYFLLYSYYNLEFTLSDLVTRCVTTGGWSPKPGSSEIVNHNSFYRVQLYKIGWSS